MRWMRTIGTPTGIHPAMEDELRMQLLRLKVQEISREDIL